MTLRFKIDENLPDAVAQLFCDAGYDAMTVHQQKMGGSGDKNLSKVCQGEGRVLVTLDLDFADVRRYPPHEFPGIIVVRPLTQEVAQLCHVVGKMLPLLPSEPITGRLWIGTESGIRIRPRIP